ncbi:Ig-like domain-containing protein [Methanobacterium oryzae]|uniref:Ig-like domain-containing protein n=1 Tax=Methanobacterium oryzae TaxID=69540 RepID=UPI003D1B0B47
MPILLLALILCSTASATTVGEALDNTNLVWTNDSFSVDTSNSHYGGSSLYSFGYGEVSTTVNGAGTLKFWADGHFYFSASDYTYDYLLDDSWTQYEYHFGPGQHNLTWYNTYTFNGYSYTFWAARLDKVEWIPDDTTPPTASANVKTGLFNYNKTVYLTMNEPGTIYYTRNGSTPSKSSTKYTGPLIMSSTTTLKFIAYDLAGNPSPVYTEKYTIDKVRPTITSVNIKNLATGISRTPTITVKFSENIKPSISWDKFYIKNLATGKTAPITKTISGNTLNIKTTTPLAPYTWYQVYIPGYSVKDYAGNNLASGYWFKFKTGKY